MALNNLAIAFLCGLAAWRLAHLLITEDGPFDIAFRFRTLLNIEGKEEIKGFWAELFSCPWCLTVWLAAVFYGVYLVAPAAVIIGAAAAIAILIEKFQKFQKE